MVSAVEFVRAMRGHAQSLLLRCNDGYYYVVKFQNNPQHLRVLANEWLATGLARLLDLTVPPCQIVEVDPSFVATKIGTKIKVSDTECHPYATGLQFGSRFLGGAMPGLAAVDYLPEDMLSEIVNLNEFCGALIFDKWTCNWDGRQVIYTKKYGGKRFRASFIDQGYCFNAGEWKFIDAPLAGVFARNLPYKRVTGWESFEPWLTIVELCSIDSIWKIAATIPTAWYDGDRFALERLVEQLFARRSRIRDLIVKFRESSRLPFPDWKAKTSTTRNVCDCSTS